MLSFNNLARVSLPTRMYQITMMHIVMKNLTCHKLFMNKSIRMPLGSMAVSKAPPLNAATRRKLFLSSLQLNLNCVRQDPSVENPLATARTATFR